MILFGNAIRLIAAVTLAFILLFMGRGWADWLRLVLMPQSGLNLVRAVARKAQCRHRLSFKGGLFMTAMPA